MKLSGLTARLLGQIDFIWVSEKQGSFPPLRSLLFAPLLFLATTSVLIAAPCDETTPFCWGGNGYETLADAEYAMRYSGGWRVFLEFQQKIGTRYVYTLPDRPHLPNPAWEAFMTSGKYYWGWRGFKSPLFNTWQEGEKWLRDTARRPTYYYPDRIVSDNLAYRGSAADGQGQTMHVFSHNLTTPAVSSVQLNQDPLFPGSCGEYTEGVPDALVGHDMHGIYKENTMTFVPEHILVGGVVRTCPPYGWHIVTIPSVHVKEVSNGYLCQDPYGSDGSQCVSDFTDEIIENNGAETYALEPPPGDCDKGSPIPNPTNPCNPADGSKTQVEIDYSTAADGGLRFTRLYNSRGAYKTGQGMPIGWRHTYSRTLDEQPDRRHKKRFSAPRPSEQSSFYYSASEACAEGFDEIKPSVWSGSLSTASATFAGGDICEISSGNSVVAYFPIRTGGQWTGFSGPSTYKTITRANGTSVRFEMDNGTWVNRLDPSTKLVASGNDWVYTDANDTKETFNSNGQLVEVAYRNGQTETLAYDLTAAQGGDDDSGTLDKVTGPFGHTITFSYDLNGILESITTPDGTIQYAIDANENLTSVVYADLSVREYVYEDLEWPNHLTGIVDENNGRFATWAYDDSGRATLSEHAGGKEQVLLAYSPDGTTTMTTAGGATHTYTFTTEQGSRVLSELSGDICSTCPGSSVKGRSYDSNGFVAEKIDWNDNVTRTARNARGLVETLTEGLGTTEERVTTTQWHATYRLPTTVTSPQNTTTYSYDASGNVTGITMAGGGMSRSWAFTYNANGQPLTINGPRTDVSDVTTLAYYNCSTGNECGQLASITNALGHVTTFDAYDGTGRVTQMTEPNGLVTTLNYDARGRVTRITETPAAGTARTTSMTYDNVGQLLTYGLPNGVTLTYTYTDAHYLASVTDNLGNRVSYTYDAMGELIGENSYDPANNLKHAIAYTNDVNRRLDTIESGGFLTDLSFDLVGNLVEEIEPGSASTQHVYDALNRLQATTDALTGVTAFSYDDHDNLTRVVAPNGATTNYTYDSLGNLVAESSPDRGITTFTHDDAGNRVTATDARGITITYTYDALNRLTSVSYPDSSENVVYAYDDVASNSIGRLTSITDQSGMTTYSYDDFGNVATDIRSISGVTYTTSYQYDASDNVASIAYPSGRTIDFGRNVAGQITQVTSTMNGVANAVVSDAGYEPFGPLSVVTSGNGVAFDYDYGADYRIRGISSAGIANKTYVYDAAANIEQISEMEVSSVSQRFESDVLHRIVSDTRIPYSEYVSDVMSDQPFIYWRLGEDRGTVAANENLDGPDGTYGSAVLLGQPGLISGNDTAIRIYSPTSSSYVASPILFGTALTGMEVWFRSESLADYRYIASLNSHWHYRMIIFHHLNGTIGIAANGAHVLFSDNPVSIDEIHHVALWYESASNTTFMMIDGITQQNTYSGDLLGMADSRLFAGAFLWKGGVATTMLGEIDEVAVYDGPVDATTFASRYSFKSEGGGAGGPNYDEFTYDANGNRTSHETASGTEILSYTPQSNQLSTVDASAILHDAAGNRTADQGGNRSFGYSDSNRLNEVFEYGASIATYVHNALGQRVRKTANSADIIYIYDVSGNLIAEHNSDGTLIRDYVWLNNMPVGQIDAGEVFSYLHFDHLGTPRLATNDSQTIVWRWDSDAFGTAAANQDPDGDSNATVINLRFPGQYYDEETGFHYNYYRTYDPSTGRYLESDPIGLDGGLNTYTYVENMPTTHVDPFGLRRTRSGNQYNPYSPNGYPSSGNRYGVPPLQGLQSVQNPANRVNPLNPAARSIVDRAIANARDRFSWSRMDADVALAGLEALNELGQRRKLEDIFAQMWREMMGDPDWRRDYWNKMLDEAEMCTRPDVVERARLMPTIGPWTPR